MSEPSHSSSSSEAPSNLAASSPESYDSSTLLEGPVEIAGPISDTFNSETADLTLRATGATPYLFFRVHRTILVDLDAGFKDVVLLYVNQLHVVVDIPLDPAILDTLLRYIYSMQTPELLSTADWQVCFLAAKMYRVKSALAALPAQLDAFIDEFPLRGFALAAMAGLDEQLNRAARLTLDIDVMNNVAEIAEFGSMPSSFLIALLEMHTRRDTLMRDWAAALTPIVGPCKGCARVHWSQAYVERLRGEVKDNPRIKMTCLFRMSLIVDAVADARAEHCPQCPTIAGEQDIDTWCHGLLDSISRPLQALSVLRPSI